MVLAAEARNLDGQVLFAKGATLTARHIEILRMWGIPNVEIEGPEEEEEPIDLDQFPPAVLAQAERAVAERFKLCKSSHPAVEVVRRISVFHTARKLVKGGGA